MLTPDLPWYPVQDGGRAAPQSPRILNEQNKLAGGGRLCTGRGAAHLLTVKVRMTYSARGSVSIRVTLMSP